MQSAVSASLRCAMSATLREIWQTHLIIESRYYYQISCSVDSYQLVLTCAACATPRENFVYKSKFLTVQPLVPLLVLWVQLVRERKRESKGAWEVPVPVCVRVSASETESESEIERASESRDQSLRAVPVSVRVPGWWRAENTARSCRTHP